MKRRYTAWLPPHVSLCEKQIKEIDDQIDELLQLVLEQRTVRVRQLFGQKQHELEEQRVKYEEQLRIAQDRLKTVEEAVNQRTIVEEHLQEIHAMGGITSLPYEIKRVILTQLVDEITLDTKEMWFEIKGTLGDKLARFDYTKRGSVVPMFGINLARPTQSRQK